MPVEGGGLPSSAPVPLVTVSPAAVGSSKGDLARPYPGTCLAGGVDRGLGLIAARSGDRISIAAPSGPVLATVPASDTFSWSPSGRHLATGGEGALWSPDGDRQGSLFDGASGRWAWSPVADCALKVDPKGLLLGVPGERVVKLARTRDLGGEPTALAFSDDGRRVALVAEASRRAPGLLAVDLTTGRIQRLVSPDPDVRVLEPALWRADGATLVYWATEDRDSLTSGSPLRAVTTTSLAPPALLAPEGGTADAEVVPAEAALQECNGELIGVVDGSVVAFQEGREPRTLIADHDRPSCSNDGAYMVAVSSEDDALQLLRSDGSRIQRLTPPDGMQDLLPSWGPGRTGVVYLRARPGADEAEVWFSQEGRVPERTVLRVELNPAPMFDWSADGPG